MIDCKNIMEALDRGSLFEIYNLYLAIGRRLQDPQRIQEIKHRLKPGQRITYLSSVDIGPVEARVIKLKRTHLLVEDIDDRRQWSIPFYFVNLDGVNPGPLLCPPTGMNNNRFKVGDRVGFRDRQNNDQYGEVIRLNTKTATILTDDRTKWRVDYRLLYPVIDGERGYPKLDSGESQIP